MTRDDEIEVSITICNNSDIAGKETVKYILIIAIFREYLNRLQVQVVVHI